ncbi:MAG: pitrilysin family protein [Polyangiaceae bacterium]
MHRALRCLGPIAPLLFLTVALAQPAPTAPPPADGAAPAPAPAVTSAPAIPMFPVEEARLGNGLRLILAPDKALPNVAVMMHYRVGSSDEPDGLHGLAHLVEHLTYEKTAHIGRGAFLRILANAGAASLNGQTGADGTTYFEVLPPERLETALWAESDRMGYFLSAVDEDGLKAQRNVIASELKLKIEDEPAGILPLATWDAAFPSWHPYHEDAEHWQEDGRALSLADVRAFFATWYGPENATLVLVGHFDPDRARRLVERYFGTLPGRPAPRRPPLPKLEIKGTTKIEIGSPMVQQELELGWVTPAVGLPGDTELDWISTILGRGEQSRLVQRLVHPGIASAVHVAQTSRRLASLFTVHVLLHRGHSAEEAIRVVDREIQSLLATGPSPAEVERAAAAWERSDLFVLDTALGRAEVIIAREERPGPLLPFDWRVHQGATPSADALKAAAAKYIAPSMRAAEVIARPKSGARLSGTIYKREEP